MTYDQSKPRTLASFKIIFLALATCLFQAAQATDMLEVYESAKIHDAVTGAARANYAATEQAVPQARSALLPSLGASASTEWNEIDFPGSSNPTPGPTFGQELPELEYNDNGWNAQLRAPILNMNGWFNVGSAKANVRAAEYSLAATEQNLIVRVVVAYLNVLRAQDLLDTTTAEEAAVRRQLEQVQQRFEVGLVAITDVLESQAVFDAAQVRRIQADGDHDIFFETLSTLTGISYDALNRLSDELPIVDPSPLAEEEWVAAALDTNLGIRAAREQLISARRNVRAERSGHLPTIDATITQAHSVTGSPNVFNADTTDATIYALQFNLPIYSGGLTRARTKQASAQAEQAAEILLDQQRIVTRDTRNLYQAVATDVVRVKARLKAIKSSQSALEATETGYEVGTRNIVDVLQAQQRLFSSQFDFADSRYNYVVDLMLLKQAVGVLADADLEELNSYTDPNSQVVRLVSLANDPR